MTLFRVIYFLTGIKTDQLLPVQNADSGGLLLNPNSSTHQACEKIVLSSNSSLLVDCY